MIEIDDAMGKPATPLSSQELEQDAREAGVDGDESVIGKDGDTHLPASETDALKADGVDRAEPAITPTPPD